MQLSTANLEVLLKMGGVFLFMCALFHLVFPGMFKWEKMLEELTVDNRRRVLNTLHLMNACQFVVWLIFAFVTWFHANDLMNTDIGKCLLTMIVLFWFIRIVIFQPLFVGFKTTLSKLQVAFFVVGWTLFVIPWVCVVC